MIPKIIHQIWIGPFEMPDIEKQYVKDIKLNNPNFEHRLWTNDNVPRLPEKLQKIYNKYGEHEDYAFQADILRLFLIFEYGGLYFDVDFKHVGSLENAEFLNYDGVFTYHKTENSFWEEDLTIPNGIFGAIKHSEIFKFLLDDIDEIEPWTGPSWLGASVRKYFNLLSDTSHDIVLGKLREKNFCYYPYHSLENNYIKHYALASWMPENKLELKAGNINFQKGKK